MINILKEDNPNYYVGILYSLFNINLDIMHEPSKVFNVLNGYDQRKFLLDTCSRNHTYIAAEFNQLYENLKDFDFESYYEKIKKLFIGRDFVVCCGEGVFKKINYNLFDYANSVEYVYGPSTNAWLKYDELYNKMKTYPKDKVLCFILGPTSKILTVNLTQDGYMCWDLGHLIKDYDYYMKKVPIDLDVHKTFYGNDL